MSSDKSEQPVGEATGEFHGDDDAQQPIGERTSAFFPDPSTPKQAPAAPGEATGELTAAALPATRAGGDGDLGTATRDFSVDAPPAPRPAAASESFEAPIDVSDIRPGSLPQRTGLRSAAQITNAASAGAFTVADPTANTGRYEMKRFHAKGGMGEIWLAEDRDLGRQVALKRILKGRESLRDQFLQEAQVTGQLEHPGVVPVHELAKDDCGQPYYVMKFVHGRTLQEVIKDYHADAPAAAAPAAAPATSAPGDVQPKEVQRLRLLNIFLSLCHTVAYAHSRGVIHRDLKPDNIMIGAYGETLVLDWGLAKVVGKDEEIADPLGRVHLSNHDDSMGTLYGSVKGTPAYFPPEMAAGQVDQVDQSSDIYLLGGVLYAILTGRPPRTAKKMKQLLELARTTPPVPPRQIWPDVPKPLNAICVKALAHLKQNRYASAAALAEDVQRYLAGEPVSAYRETWAERAWRWVKKHRKGLTRAVSAVVLFAVAWITWSLVRDANLRSAAAQQVANKLQKEERARQEISDFRGLVEEARFHAAKADPLSETAPFFDLDKIEKASNAALALADRWGPDLTALPLSEQRPPLKGELYNMLIEFAQAKTLKGGAEPARAALALLERAAPLREPTRSFYRLRAHCLEVVDQGDKGEADLKKAAAADVPTTALDVYLQAEQMRRASLAPRGAGGDVAHTDPKETLRLRREVLTRAMAEYRNALAKDADHYWSYFQLGACHLALGQAAEAVETLGACVALRPKTSWGYTSRALALAALKRYEQAHSDLAKAMDCEPESLVARLNRGVVYLEQHKYEPALADFNAVLEAPADERLLEAAFSRGQLYMQQDKFELALADFDFLLEKKIPIRNIHLWRARILLVQGNLPDCFQSLSVYVTDGPAAKDPKHLEQICRELRVLVTNEVKAEARQLRADAFDFLQERLAPATALAPKSPGLFAELGAAQEQLAALRPKDALALIKGAIKSYTQGLAAAPKDARLLVKRGWAFVNLNANESARDDFAAAVALASPKVLDKEHAEACAGLGYTQACLDGSSEALRSAIQALLHDAADVGTLHNVACIYAKLSDRKGLPQREYQDMTIDLLKRGVQIWSEKGKTGLNPINLIEQEVAFSPALRSRPDFAKLLENR